MFPAALHTVYFDLSSSAAAQLPLFLFLGPLGSSPAHHLSHFHLQYESLVIAKWLQYSRDANF